MEPQFSICEIDEFMTAYLPDASQKTFDSVIRELEREKVLALRQPSRGRQRSTNNQRPIYTHALNVFKGLFRQGSAKTTRVIESLQGVATAVQKALQKVTGTNIKTRAIRASKIEDECPSEAYLTANLDGPVRYTDVLVPLTVTGLKSATDETHVDPTEGLFRIMKGDVRRKFSFAITVQGENMSLWYLSRPLCVKTAPISIFNHPDFLIHVLVGFLSATEQQLGYDSLVTLLQDRTYVYELPPDGQRLEPLYYRTIELVSEIHAQDPAGRSTRVWRVQRVVSKTDPTQIPGEPEVILKDAFLDRHTPTEADVQERLFQDITVFSRKKDWRNQSILKDFPSADLQYLAEALTGENFKNYFSCITDKFLSAPLDTSTLPLGQTSTSGTSAHPGLPKRRCFFVYELICTPLSDIPTLGEAIDVLRQCRTALQLMFCAGWLHGDLSPGNILAFRSSPDTPWQVKLSDLEFSKKFPITGAAIDEVVMGTPQFIASELQSSRYIYPRTRKKGQSGKGIRPKLRVVRNFQHDVESMFWIILWLVTMRAIKSLSRAFPKEYFGFRIPEGTMAARFNLLTQGNSLWELPDFEDSIPPPLRDEDCPFLDELDDIRYDLQDQYETRNKEGRQGDIEAYSRIMGEAMSTFFNRIEGSREKWEGVQLYTDLTLHPAHRRDATVLLPALSPSMKRKLEDPEAPVPSRRIGGDADRPRKRVRLDVQSPCQRAGPVTRSMTRSQAQAGPMTRSATRRLQQSTTKGVAAMPTRSSTRKTPR
ncbi:other/FunK1 protein kinase [Coprinopsis cinerea okayama7|uniref:Other/FunK1 protein kinase n=1 Tax=Coprinopsis cinerea (strain Okayama-7 / 130 / ATCC MYA-4618 / FGSC 9003) TaxID=240176 RepID=A8NB60_COPC7|nr:other/FunK1 protein kinase [Coprinopsis cinerea okayama7\|eukprot:XP_001832061.2 other/FunK1 protein kinase [Coprinopsis cinerea okayama7\